jgi:hypothetical protein
MAEHQRAGGSEADCARGLGACATARFGAHQSAEMKLSVFAAIVLASALTAHADQEPPPPACRLSAELRVPIEEAATRALGTFRALGIDSPLVKPVINRVAGGAAELEIDLVTDATLEQTDSVGCPIAGRKRLTRDFDIHTVGGICAAAPPNRVMCSADSLRDLTREEGVTSRASVVLLYVIGHEIGHLVLHHEAPSVRTSVMVDLNSPLPEKVEDVTARIEKLPAEIEQEKTADRFSLRILRYWVAKPYLDSQAGPNGTLTLAGNDFRKLIETSNQVSRPWEAVRLPVTDQDVQVKARTLACALSGTKGTLALPIFGGTHPDWPSRIAFVTSELAASAKPGANAEANASLKQRGLGNLGDLLGAVGAINERIDEEYADYYSRLGTAFRQTLAALQKSTLKCGGPR